MHSRLTLCGLLVLAVLAYSPVRSAGFVYEDAHWQTGLRARSVEPSWSERSLAYYSLRANAETTGGDPLPFHATNVALHLVNGLLVYGLLAALLPGLPAVVGAGTHLLHPLNSEAVAYVAGRTELVSTGLLLAAVLVGLRRLTPARAGLAAVLVYAAFLAKPSAVVGVVLVPLLWGHRRRLSLVGAIPWLPLAVPLTLAATTILRDPYTHASPDGPFAYAALQASALLRYLALVVWPVGFSVDHDIAATPPWLASLALVCGVLLVLAAAVTWALTRSTPALAVLWIVLAVAPRFVIRLPEYLNEHQMYLSMVGVSLAVASAVAWTEQRRADVRQ